MIAVDTNILIYAFRADSPFHTAARACLEQAVAEGRRLAVPWPCVHEFVSVVSNPRMPDPASPVLAMEAVDALLAAPRVEAIGETDHHLLMLERLLSGGLVRGPRVHDARIAAICLSHGVDELWTADRDFSLFPSLRTRNPLAGS